MVTFCIGFGIIYQVQICKSDKKRETRVLRFGMRSDIFIPGTIIKSEWRKK